MSVDGNVVQLKRMAINFRVPVKSRRRWTAVLILRHACALGEFCNFY